MISQPPSPTSLSVVVPIYNAGEVISRLLDCFSQQDIGEPWEIVFVNNRSTDNSVSVVEHFVGKLPPYKIVEAKAVAGAGYARNVGVNVSGSPFLAFCDADDEIPADWAGKMLSGIRAHGFIGCRIGDLKYNQKKFVGFMTSGPYSLGYFPFTGGGTMGIRKDIFLEVGGFDDSLKIAEDVDFCYRVQMMGYEFHYFPDTEIFYRSRNSEWEFYRQRLLWGRYEKAIAMRYKRFGHCQKIVPGLSVGMLIKHLILYVLTCHNSRKRINYGSFVCKILATMMPPLKESHLPVKIDETKLDQNAIGKYANFTG